MPIINRISEFHEKMIEWRQDIHSHPELAYQEKRTARKVADLLKEFGVDEIHEGIGGTGVVGVIKNGVGPMIGLRADMDALPITEANQCEYVSKNKGVMHACGHDGHTTMLLGAARYLSETRNFNGQVILIFQPAEEGFAGAKAMIDDGLFEKFPIDAIYGMHNMPGVAVGNLDVGPGPRMAAADNFEIKINGKGAHGAMPNESVDPIVCGSAVVQALQSLVSRNSDPKKTLVVSVTEFNSGQTLTIKGIAKSDDSRIDIEIANENNEVIATLETPITADGTFSVPWVIPNSLEIGTYTITVSDAENSDVVTIFIN